MILLGALSPAAQPGRGTTAPLPADWLARWSQPPAEDRPLQIIHGFDPRKATPEGVQQMVRGAEPSQVARLGLQSYLDRGLGGVVCNVAFESYMRSEESFAALLRTVSGCQKLGMVVWLYDEEGYPSGAAGGLVLKEDPEFEATELAFDAARDDPFIIRPAYEHTHASNNYYAARRYVNLLDDRAIRSFIAHTHDVYWQRLKPYFGTTIQATFTDEPSLIAVCLGQIPEPVRKKVPVVDPIDPSVRPLPAVPWGYDLPKQYRKRYGEDLMAQRRSLFAGESAEDRKVRRQFWGLVADLVAERYFAAIQKWCSRHGIASSGHCLWEEALMHHPALEGNGLKALGFMDIPGLDVLSSDPEAVIHGGWMTAALPASAALLNGRRRVMTEVSDFSQKMSGQGPVGLAEMQATAAWQAAWGVTDFTLYYSLADRSAEQYRAYCNYVGRLNAILKPARLAPQVLLYYPVYDLWAEYLPVAEPLRLESQSPRAQRIVRSFMQLGQMLQRSQIPFALIDHEYLAKARAQSEGTLAIKNQRLKALIVPEGVELPPEAARVVERFRKKGGMVIADGAGGAKLTGQSLIGALRPAYRLSPASDRIALGQFVRDGRPVLLLANVGREPYNGILATDAARAWQHLDPATGAIQPARTEAPGRLRLSLAARQAILLVQ
jgi:hypothetical protein